MVDKTFVNSLVSFGFDQVKGLSDEITFSNSSSSEFNFSDLAPVIADPEISVFNGVVGNVTRDSSSRSFLVDVLFKSEDVPSADQYDTAIFRGRTWNVLDFYSDGYTTTVSFGGS